MSAPDLPMPSGGGTYMRDPVTHELTEVLPQPEDTPELSPVSDPAPAKARKSPLKEG